EIQCAKPATTRHEHGGTEMAAGRGTPANQTGQEKSPAAFQFSWCRMLIKSIRHSAGHKGESRCLRRMRRRAVYVSRPSTSTNTCVLTWSALRPLKVCASFTSSILNSCERGEQDGRIEI